MFCADLFKEVKKLGQALAYDVGIAADVHKIRVSVPARYDVDVKMLGQSGPAASAEIHADIKAVRFYRQREGFLRCPNQLEHLEQLIIIRFIQLADMSDRRYQQMAVVIRVLVQYYDAFFRSPEDEVFIVVLRIFQVMTDKAVTFFVQSLHVVYSPRRP